MDTGRGDFMMEVLRRDGAKDGCNADPGRVKLLGWFKDGWIIEDQNENKCSAAFFSSL